MYKELREDTRKGTPTPQLKKPSMLWHQKPVHEVLTELGSSTQGLSNEEAQRRLLVYGLNELKDPKKKTPFMMFLDQFKDFMIFVLVVAAVISGIIGEPSDTVAILLIVFLNALIGFVQEHRAERAMAALKQMASPTATVLRDGLPTTIPAAQIVPGDLVILESGNLVPADMRLMEAVQLRVDESPLTGESVPVDKHVQPLPQADLPLGERRNMAYKGTFVTHGRGIGIVTETGMNTELGKIALLLQQEKDVKTPLQKRLAKFGQQLAVVVFVICALVFGIGVMRGESPLLMLLTAISLAVAAIPEALPAVVTVTLALGAKQMVRHNVLIKKLPAVETLGSVTYICTDKTGTLTLNKLTVEQIWTEESSTWAEAAEGNPQLHRDGPTAALLVALALNNDAQVDAVGNVMGDAIDVALYRAAKERGFEKQVLEQVLPRVGEIPFDPERKCMTTIHRVLESEMGNGQGSALGKVGVPFFGSRFVSFTKGAVEVLVARSENVATARGTKAVEESDIVKISEKMALNGLRVLCIAMRRWDELPKDVTPDQVERGLTILGLVGMMDPPRPEAKEAVKQCKSAGITPVMITGDHALTAKAIAKRLEILEEEDERRVVTGRELEEMSVEQLEEIVKNVRVYARVVPEQKLKIVMALQRKGEFVAMTGDGVNDAPALKRADIGVAMGMTGTDVAKEAAHMVLLDDNFATIVKAVSEGRRIFDNIRKFIKYTMTSNSGEIWTMLLAPLLGLPVPLLPIHILWINLVTDGLPGLALAAEPAEENVMKRGPRSPKESIFAGGLGAHVIWVGLLMGCLAVLAQAWFAGAEKARWQTMVFTVLCFSQMAHVLAIRSERESLFRLGVWSNRWVLGAVALTFALQLAIVYVPGLKRIFKTEALSVEELGWTVALASIVFVAVEIEKWIRRRREGKKGVR